MATNHCLLNGGDDLWEGGPSEDLALAVKGVKPIGTESVPSRFAAERQKCLWQRAHILKAKNLPALECICMAAMCTTAPAFLAQGPILWRPSGTWWNQWWNPIDLQLTTYVVEVRNRKQTESGLQPMAYQFITHYGNLLTSYPTSLWHCMANTGVTM